MKNYTRNKSGIDILVHVEDPGAINFLKELPTFLNQKGYSFIFICHGVAIKKFQSEEYFFREKIEDPDLIINKLKPSLVILGTSENPNSFAFPLIKSAKKSSIPTIGVIDCAINTRNRFRGNTADPIFYSPDELFVPDQKTKDEFSKLGFDQKNILITGNPIYQNALNFREDTIASKQINRNLMESSTQKLKILFISESWDKLDPSASRKNVNYKLHGRGDSDFRTIIVMEELIDSLKRSDIEAQTSLRLHPNSSIEDFKPISSEFDEISSISDPYEDCLNCDLVIGISSMLLLEASLIGKPTLSIMPDLNEFHWMPNNYLGPTNVVSTRQKLESYWKKRKFLEYEYSEQDWVPVDQIKKIMDRISELLE